MELLSFLAIFHIKVMLIQFMYFALHDIQQFHRFQYSGIFSKRQDKIGNPLCLAVLIWYYYLIQFFSNLIIFAWIKVSVYTVYHLYSIAYAFR